MNTTLAYAEIEAALEPMDADLTDPEDVVGDRVAHLLGEIKTPVVLEYLAKNCWKEDDKTATLEIFPDGVRNAKRMGKEIDKARRSFWGRNKEKSSASLKVLEDWGFTPHQLPDGGLYISNDVLEYCSGYILEVCSGIELCLKNKKKAA